MVPPDELPLLVVPPLELLLELLVVPPLLEPPEDELLAACTVTVTVWLSEPPVPLQLSV